MSLPLKNFARQARQNRGFAVARREFWDQCNTTATSHGPLSASPKEFRIHHGVTENTEGIDKMKNEERSMKNAKWALGATFGIHQYSFFTLRSLGLLAQHDPFDEPCVDVPALEILVVHDLEQEWDRGFDRGDVELGQGAAHCGDGFGASGAVDDQFADH